MSVLSQRFQGHVKRFGYFLPLLMGCHAQSCHVSCPLTAHTCRAYPCCLSTFNACQLSWLWILSIPVLCSNRSGGGGGGGGGFRDGRSGGGRSNSYFNGRDSGRSRSGGGGSGGGGGYGSDRGAPRCACVCKRIDHLVYVLPLGLLHEHA